MPSIYIYIYIYCNKIITIKVVVRLFVCFYVAPWPFLFKKYKTYESKLNMNKVRIEHRT